MSPCLSFSFAGPSAKVFEGGASPPTHQVFDGLKSRQRPTYRAAPVLDLVAAGVPGARFAYIARLRHLESCAHLEWDKQVEDRGNCLGKRNKSGRSLTLSHEQGEEL